MISGDRELTDRSTSQYDVYSQPKNTESSYTRSMPVESDRKPVNTNDESGTKSVEKSINPALAGALMGGLIGASIGALTGLLGGRKTSQGFDRAKRGVSHGVKTVGEGLSHTAKGLGDVAKSFGDGISYAVVGGTEEAVEKIGEGTKQAADALKNTAANVNEAVKDAADSGKTSSEAGTQSVTNAAESVKDVADNAQSFENRSVEERVSIDVDYDNPSVINTYE